MGNQKNQTPADKTAEKKMTKYDLKMQARKEAEAREKRQSMITRITALIVLVLVVIVAVAVPLTKRISAKGEYIRIGDHSLSKIDYDFYYGYSVNSYLAQYSYILPYMGLDTTKSFDSQQFDDTTTWQQYFDQMTATNIRQYLALSDDAKKTGFTYDMDAAYESFYKDMTEAATTQGVSLKTYLKNMFGSYATKSSLKDCVTTFLTAQAYYSQILEDNKPTKAEIDERYEEKKRDYDNIHFSAFDIAADIPEDATDEQKEEAMAAAKKKADEFVSRFKNGEEFLALCREFATEEQAKKYEAEDASAYQDSTYAGMHSAYRDWLFDEERKENEITAIESDSTYYVVLFNLREKPDTVDDDISNTIASEKSRTYLDGISEGYTLSDPKDHLNLKALESADKDDESGDDSKEDGSTPEDDNTDKTNPEDEADGNNLSENEDKDDTK